ncbi:hypothetical protein [Niabella sp.]|uniref:hypothetical protein n=1 Tax=Niabella sp. TaxID=1962976 RepID=UPI00262962E0|nr:hypothetical protein [Niabella sp.]
MDSIKMSDFLFSRIENTIKYKAYIKEVSIGYEYNETFGNSYVRLSYYLDVSDALENLPYQEQDSAFIGSPTYTFTLSTYKDHGNLAERKILRLTEFKHIYESLAAYAVLQLEEHLLPGTAIIVKGIDFWPEANYAKKYLYTALQDDNFKVTYGALKNDVWQWNRLHELAKKSKLVYLKNKDQFNLTDIQVHQISGIDIERIRSVLLEHNVPIKIKGIRTIDEVRIHVAELVEALKKKLKDDYYRRYHGVTYRYLITHLYNHYLPAEKTNIVRDQQSYFLEHFIIQKDDILELKNKQIVQANIITFDVENNIYVTYTILKDNLQPGQRTRTIKVCDVDYFLSAKDFSVFTHDITRKSLFLLKRWMLKRKKKAIFKPFKPDLFIEKATAIVCTSANT